MQILQILLICRNFHRCTFFFAVQTNDHVLFLLMPEKNNSVEGGKHMPANYYTAKKTQTLVHLIKLQVSSEPNAKSNPNHTESTELQRKRLFLRVRCMCARRLL